MIVLGIDPGLAKLGYGLVEKEKGGVRFCAAGVLKTTAQTPLPERLAALHKKLTALCETHSPKRVVVERVFPHKKLHMHRVGEVRGVVLLLAARFTMEVEEVSPKAAKLFTTRSGAAGKKQMQKTVQRILHMEAPPKADAADALALALIGCQKSIA